MKNLNKINRMMEWFWLVVAIVSFVGVTVFACLGGETEGGVLFAFPCLAFLMYFFRRMFRKKMEKREQ